MWKQKSKSISHNTRTLSIYFWYAPILHYNFTPLYSSRLILKNCIGELVPTHLVQTNVFWNYASYSPWERNWFEDIVIFLKEWLKKKKKKKKVYLRTTLKEQTKISRTRQTCAQTTVGPAMRGRVSQQRHQHQLSTCSESVFWRPEKNEAVKQIIFYKG